jgi:WD40 repeat protein
VSGERGLFRWPIQPALAQGELRIGPAAALGPPGDWEQTSLAADGSVFAVYRDDHVSVFDANTLLEIARTGECGEPAQSRYVSLSSDGQKLATGGWLDTAVNIWDAHRGRRIRELNLPDWRPLGSPTPIFDPGGSALIVGCCSNFCVFTTNSWMAGPRYHRNGLSYMAISHKGRLLASAFTPTAIQLTDIDTGEVLATLQSPIVDHPIAMAFSPDDTQLAVVHWGTRDLLVWDLRLLRDDLKRMGMDWAGPPYPAAFDPASFHPLRIQVLTNTEAAVSGNR